MRLAQRVDRGRVGKGEGQHGAVVGAGLPVHGRQVRPHLVEVPTDPDQVVPAAEDGHQVGLEGESVIELAVADLVEPQTADGEIGVLQRLVLRVGDQLRQPVGPAPVAAVAVRVDQTLGAGVADGDVAVEGGHPPIVAQRGVAATRRFPDHPCVAPWRTSGRTIAEAQRGGRGGRTTVPAQPVRAGGRPAAPGPGCLRGSLRTPAPAEPDGDDPAVQRGRAGGGSCPRAATPERGHRS